MRDNQYYCDYITTPISGVNTDGDTIGLDGAVTTQLTGFELENGTVLCDRYKVLKLIGRGGMSLVYLVLDEKLNRNFALKQTKRLYNSSLPEEYVLMKKLWAPFFPHIYHIFEAGDELMVVMDYIEGQTLSQMLEKGGAFPQKKVIQIAKELCIALDCLHQCTPPIIFRDVKPSNIIVQPDGSIRMIDFGIAKELTDESDSISLGTRGYASPEHFGGRTDQRSDIYSLGITLIQLATGISPLDDRQPDLSVLSKGFEYILLKCTNLVPEERYQSCRMLLHDLLNVDSLQTQKQNFWGTMDEFRRSRTKKGESVIGYVAAEKDPIVDTTVLGIQWGADSAVPQGSYVYDDASTAQTVSLSELPTTLDVTEFLEGKKYIFVSYSHSDREAVKVINMMVDNGFRVWFDRGIDPGSEWADTIAEKIKKCSYFISLMSKNYLNSINCTSELNYSVGRVENRMMIYLEDIRLPDKFELYHGSIQAIHEYRYENSQEFISALCSAKGMTLSLFCDNKETQERFLAVTDIVSAPQKQIFLAYSINDYLRFGRMLAERLSEEGAAVWHKLGNSTGVESYLEEARTAIKGCDRYVFFMSDDLLSDSDDKHLLDSLLASGVGENTIFGVVTEKKPAWLADYFDELTVIRCAKTEQLKAIADMILA